MRRRGIEAAGIAAVAVAVLCAAPAGADETKASGSAAGQGRVYGTTTTYLTVRQILDPSDPASVLVQVPFYEYLTVGGDDLGTPGFSFHLTGFGGVNVTAPGHVDRVFSGGDWTDASRFSGDLLVGTLSYRSPKGMVLVRAGRQVLYEGAGANVMMDGAYVRVRPGAAVELSAFGGFVPYPRFAYDAARVVYGGRVAYDPWDWGRIGVSFVEERASLEGSAERARSTLGVDLAFRRFRQLDLEGSMAVDLIYGAVQEARVLAAVILDRDWTFDVDYGMSNPSSLIPKTSIFSVFTDRYYHSVGADVAYRGSGWLGAQAAFRWFFYDDGVNGYEASLKPTLSFPETGGMSGTVGLEGVRLQGADNAYWEARAFGIYRPHPRVSLTANVENFFYDNQVKGYDRSHVMGLTAGWEAFRGGRIQGDFLVTLNPDFQQALSGMLKFTYAFDVAVGGKRGAP